MRKTAPLGRRAGLVAGLSTLALLGIPPLAAQADDPHTYGCTGSLSVQTCLDATTGAKDPAAGTQWVGWVRTYTSESTPGNTHGIVQVESWGDGFYFSTAWDPQRAGADQTWGAQRWVRSGTNVCGAITYESGYREVACIEIRV